MLVNPVLTICILMKDYYDIDRIEAVKARIARMPHFRFFISSQYRAEPKYDIYVVSDETLIMLKNIKADKDVMRYIDMISVNEI
jgi:hypothetical protein